MREPKLTKKELQKINICVDFFESKIHLFDTFAQSLAFHLGDNEELSPYIHFMKYRVKDVDHLREKIKKKALEQKRHGKTLNINPDNLFTEIPDLAGVRILHLHTEQIREINRIVLSILEEHQYSLIDGPSAICWDVEYEKIFQGFGIQTDTRESMYTSIHYIIGANKKTKITAELQIRTLMEEVWGEVSHRVDYPNESTVRSCRDQLKVLARLTSGCTRLVDSIFKSNAESGGSI